MKIVSPKYSLIRTQTDDSEWLFKESDEAYEVTLKFDAILEKWRGLRGLTSELRKFLNRHPWHFDAMNHYAACKLDEGRVLDALAFSQTAVSSARSAFPFDFQEGKHRIPGGFVQNRPFLRCMYQLMVAQAAINEYAAAIHTGEQMIRYDYEDRMGARMELPKYLLREGLYRKTLQLFEDERFKDTFHQADYLYPLAFLGVGEVDNAKAAIADCLYKPKVAKYLLNPCLPQPEPEQPFFGVVSGSDLEGFLYAREYLALWESFPKGIEMLRELAQPAEAENWPSYFRPKNSED